MARKGRGQAAANSPKSRFVRMRYAETWSASLPHGVGTGWSETARPLYELRLVECCLRIANAQQQQAAPRIPGNLSTWPGSFRSRQDSVTRRAYRCVAQTARSGRTSRCCTGGASAGCGPGARRPRVRSRGLTRRSSLPPETNGAVPRAWAIPHPGCSREAAAGRSRG
jgi:hypothetical protein